MAARLPRVGKISRKTKSQGLNQDNGNWARGPRGQKMTARQQQKAAGSGKVHNKNGSA